MAEVVRPRVYDYLELKKFIFDFLTYLQFSKKLSLNKINQMAGFKSPGYLQLLLDGKRPFTEQNIEKIGRALELPEIEIHYLQLMSLQDQQESIVNKQLIVEKMNEIKLKHAPQELESEQFSFFKDWYYPAVFVYLGKLQKTCRASDLAEAFGLKPHQADKVLKDLAGLQLIRQVGEEWESAHSQLETEKKVDSEVLRSFHKSVIGKALEHIDEKDSEERNLQALVLDLNHSQFVELSERIWHFVKEIQSEDRKSPDRVYQMNIQLFPLSD